MVNYNPWSMIDSCNCIDSTRLLSVGLTDLFRLGGLCHPTLPLICLAGKDLVMALAEKAGRLKTRIQMVHRLLPQRKKREREGQQGKGGGNDWKEGYG